MVKFFLGGRIRQFPRPDYWTLTIHTEHLRIQTTSPTKRKFHFQGFGVQIIFEHWVSFLYGFGVIFGFGGQI